MSRDDIQNILKENFEINNIDSKRWVDYIGKDGNIYYNSNSNKYYYQKKNSTKLDYINIEQYLRRFKL